MKQRCVLFPLAGCSTAWKSRGGRRKLGESRALSIPKYSGPCKLLSPPQDWKMQQVAPHLFFPEGAGSGICKDSALGGTGQAMAVERTFCPQGDWLFIINPVPHRSFHAILGQMYSLCALSSSLRFWLGWTFCI